MYYLLLRFSESVGHTGKLSLFPHQKSIEYLLCLWMSHSLQLFIEHLGF